MGWHDAGTYNKNIEEWPQRGGANGSLRFEVELKHGANAGNILHFVTFSFAHFLIFRLTIKPANSGLVNALKLLQPIKDKYANVTYADLFQLASATAIEVIDYFCFFFVCLKVKIQSFDFSTFQTFRTYRRLEDQNFP